MPRRPSLTLSLLAVAALFGCTDSRVDVPVPATAGAEVDAVCAELLRELPDEIAQVGGRREVTGDAGRTAAWGDPPVTLECGVPSSDEGPDSVVVNGVDWSVREVEDGYRWVTYGREVPVAVTVPAAYDNPVEVIYPFSDAVAVAVPRDPDVSPLVPTESPS